MQGRDDRLVQLLEHRHAVVVVDAVVPDPVQPELVLDVHDVGRGLIDRARGAAIARLVPLPDAPADLGAVRVGRVRLVDRGGHATHRRVGRFHRGQQIGRERGDAAPARDRGGDEGDTDKTILG